MRCIRGRGRSAAAALLIPFLAGMLTFSTVQPSVSQWAAGSPDADFTVSSFNVLGSSHTRGPRGRAPGTVRIRWAAQLLKRHGVDVVGFQEFQANQAAAFLRVTGGRFATYPGNSLTGKRSGENSIAWRTSMWRVVKATTIGSPYHHGTLRPMPVVLLRHRGTGITAWFANFHNPASTRYHRRQKRWRIRATALQVALARRLNQTGVPVFIVGDMNSRRYYYCRMTAGAPMQSAGGGTNTNGGCNPRGSSVDWIFGSEQLDFRGYVAARGRLVRRTSDHPMIVSRVRINAGEFRAIRAP